MPIVGEYEPSTSQWVADQVAEYEASGGTRANDPEGHRPPGHHRHDGGGQERQGAQDRPHAGRARRGVPPGGQQGRAPEHPGWYANLTADPHVMIQDGPDPHDFVVRELEGAERELWWDRAVAAFAPYAEYAERAGRIIPILLATPA